MNASRTCFAFLAASLVLSGSCHKSSNSGNAQVSDELTAGAVGDMLSGSTDYAGMRDDLIAAVAANGNNTAAKVWLGVATVMVEASEELAPDGALNQLLQRGGLVQTGTPGSLWDFGLQLENHGQGMFKDSTPTLGEIQAWVHGTFRPALADLLAVLDAVPPDFEYVIPAASGGLLLQRVAPGQSIDLRLDYGDVQLLAALGHGLQAGLDLLRAVDFDDLAPNELDPQDTPGLDVLEVLHTNYPDFGRLANAGELLTARDRIRTCFQAFERAMLHLRGENAQQQAQGLVTLGRDTFANEQQREAFLFAEAQLRAMVDSLIDMFYVDQVVRFDTDPLTGDPLPLADQIELNFFRFFQGVDLRQTYGKTVIDPLTGERTMGVSSLAELTSAMTTFGNVLVSVGGQAPGPGDLQHLVYALRADTPPQSTKTIDGDFGDWAANALRVLASPTALVDHPSPDFGSLWVSVDNDALYVHLDEDLIPYLTELDDRMEIYFEGPSGWAAVVYANGSGFMAMDGYGLPPTYGYGPGGLEIRFPLGPGAGQWARLERSAVADNATWYFDIDSQPVFVKVR
jgi:hypothetical protein